MNSRVSPDLSKIYNQIEIILKIKKNIYTHFKIKQFLPLGHDVEEYSVNGARQCDSPCEQYEEDYERKSRREVNDLRGWEGREKKKTVQESLT